LAFDGERIEDPFSRFRIFGQLWWQGQRKNRGKPMVCPCLSASVFSLVHCVPVSTLEERMDRPVLSLVSLQ